MDNLGRPDENGFALGHLASTGMVLLYLCGLFGNCALMRLLFRHQAHIDPMIKGLLIMETCCNLILSLFESKCFFYLS